MKFMMLDTCHLRRNEQTHLYTWYLDSFLLLVFLGTLFFLFLGNRPLFTPDEGRYAEIGREMFLSHDYVTPYLNGIKYFEKPILFYWLEVFAIKTMGLNLWALRSINAGLGLFACWFTYFTSRKLFNRCIGLLSALILGTSTLFFVMAHMISLDLPVTVFISSALYAFLLATTQNRHQLFYMGLAAFCAACSVLTKGLIGIVFPAMIISLWLLVTRESRILKLLFHPVAILIFLMIVLPWHMLVMQRNPEFFHFYFIEQHLLRYTDKSIGHYQPIWFFIPTLILGFFPWSVFLPQALRVWKKAPGQKQNNKITIFFFLWFVTIFIFFSFSKSKLIPYILPIFPPLAILVALYLYSLIDKHGTAAFKISQVVLFILSIIIAYTYVWFTQRNLLPDQDSATLILSVAAMILISGMTISTIVSFLKVKESLLLSITSMWFFLLFSHASLPAIDTRTIFPLAQTLKPLLKPSDEIISYNQYYQDLPFYLQRRVTVLNWRNEFSFGMEHQNTKKWMIQDEKFWQRWHGPHRVFALMSLSEYHFLRRQKPNEKIYFVDSTLTNALISNQVSDKY